MAKHNRESNESNEGNNMDQQANGSAPVAYQFKAGRAARINSHIGTLNVKSGSTVVRFTKENGLQGEAYKDLDYTGKAIKGQNELGWRFAMSSFLPYPSTENVTTKEQLLQIVSDLYDDTVDYNSADQVTSISGKVTGAKAFASLCESTDKHVAQQLIEDFAYGVGLRYQNKLMRKAMVEVAEPVLRAEGQLAAPTTKAKVAKPEAEDTTADEI